MIQVIHIDAQERVHSSLRMTEIKLQIEPDPRRLPPSLPGSITVPDIHPPLDWAQSKAVCVSAGEATTTCQTCDSCYKLTHLAHGQGGHITHRALPHAPDILTTWNIVPSQSGSSHCWHIFHLWNCYYTPISQLHHESMAHEINLSQVLCCLDHFQSDSGVPYSTKVTQQWAVSQDIQWTFPVPNHPQSSAITKLWNSLLKNHLPGKQKTKNKKNPSTWT